MKDESVKWLGVALMDADFEPEGWSAFDDHGTHGDKGNAGCALALIVIVIIAILGKICGC